MKKIVTVLCLCLASGALAENPDWQRAHFNYRMSCQGCHAPDGSGAGAVPRMKDQVGQFLETRQGREYLVRVPGSATSALDDEQLAEVLNWIIQEFAGDSAADGYQRYTPLEVARLRQEPLNEVEQYRTQLLVDIARAKTCVACHGQNGNSSNPEWPNLAGQKAGYLAAQLKAFRDGARSNSAMAPFVANLGDTEITALAEYFSSLPAASSASGNVALVAQGENLSGYCKACHGVAGQTINLEWPNIAGQQAAYLSKQLQAFKSGSRFGARMQPVVSHMGDAEFDALAAYYSQLR